MKSQAHRIPLHGTKLHVCMLGGVFVLLFLFGWMPLDASAQSTRGNAGEDRVKAAYLYKLPNYVDWPASSFVKADSPYVIGIVDADDIADELVTIASGRQINHRAITVKKLRAGEPSSGVHLLFIGRNERNKMLQSIKAAQLQPTLVVTDTEGALGWGSMMNFITIDDRVRIEVSLDAAEKSGLKLSARLLAIAVSVIKEGQK